MKVLLSEVELAFDIPPQMINDRTMVPMRRIFEVLDAEVEWDGNTQTITAARGENVVIMQIGNPMITISGESITLDVPPQLVNNHTLVLIRVVAEGLAAEVEWDGENQTVIIAAGLTIPVFDDVK